MPGVFLDDLSQPEGVGGVFLDIPQGPVQRPVGVPQGSPATDAIARIRAVDPGYAQMKDAQGWERDPISAYRVFHAADSEPLDDSSLGSAWRGFKSSALPAAAGTIAGAVGSLFTPFVGVPAGIGAGAAAANFQNSLMPPDAHDIAQAQFDEEHHKAARIGGQFFPMAATLKPSLSALSGRAVARAGGNPALGTAIGVTAGAGIPAAMALAQGQPLDPARIVTGGVLGAGMTPNRLGSALFDKAARTSRGAQSLIDARLQQRTADPAAAERSISQGARDLNVGGVKIPSGLLAQQAGMEKQTQDARGWDAGGLIAQRERDNAAAIAGNMGRTNAQQGAPPEEAAQFFQRDAAGQRAAINAEAAQRMMGAESGGVPLPPDALPAAQAALGAETAAIAARKGTSADSSEKLHGILKGTMQGVEGEKNRIYNQLDPNKVEPAPVGNLQAVTQKALEPDSQLQVTDIEKYLTSNKDENVIQRILNPKNPIAFGDLGYARQELSDAIQRAKDANDGLAVPKLSAIKQALEDTVNQHPKGAEGNAFFKANVAPNFRQLGGEKLRDQVKSGTEVPSDTGGLFLKANSAPAAKESAAQLRRIIRLSPDKKEATLTAREFVLGKLAEFAGEKPLTAEKAQAFMSRHSELLDQAPALRKEIGRMANRIGNKSQQVGTIEAEIKARQDEMARVGKENEVAIKAKEAEISASASGRFASTSEHSKAVANIMKGEHAADNAKAMMADAAKDNTGKATEGVKNAFKNWINDSIRTSENTTDRTSKPGFDPNANPISSADLNNLIKAHKGTLVHVFGKQTMDAYELGLRQLQTAKGGLKSQVAGSDTAERMANAAETNSAIENGLTVGSHLLRIGSPSTQGNTGIRVSGNLGETTKMIERMWRGDTRALARKMMVQAELDPPLMQEMLRRITPDNRSRFIKVLKAVWGDQPVSSDVFRTYVPGKSEKDESAPDIGPLPAPKAASPEPPPADSTMPATPPKKTVSLRQLGADGKIASADHEPTSELADRLRGFSATYRRLLNKLGNAA